ncbi:fatty acid desaturase [Leptospira perolatii]|uniref:Fatty acid desaturase n=1 Tax=Leptospira perolatii TaxID=2023191 RepID=A0A2M9ZIV8_9LEPT|nr:fatty acid desaturase [Leptospira perolatii]PJZ68653.1 fatty acid desaturase [Leptospira perolatii]PJZ72000.1 fatty acid desaturase [Leptospira perolatii]
MNLGKNKLNLTEEEKTKRIIRWIRYADKRLRRKYRILQYQDSIGMCIALGSAFGMILLGTSYILGWISAWICIFGNAIFASLLHEMEHDLIHNLYYKKSPKIQNFLFWIVWLFRLNVVNSWFRKEIHLLHHKVSGNKEDVEERFIGNGMPFGWRRILTMVDPVMALAIQGPKIARDSAENLKKIQAPHRIGIIREVYLLLWYSFLALSLFSFLVWLFNLPFEERGWIKEYHEFLNIAAIVYMIPSWIRQTAIQVVSSNMHYYGDIGNLYRQTQVLDSWIILPLHLFCFNFGSTHGIHHFVVNQPFYIRQAVSPFVKPALRKYGIRFNDFRSMFSSNGFVEELRAPREPVLNS